VLARPVSAPKDGALPATAATAAQSMLAPAPAATFVPVALPDFSTAFSVQQDSGTGPHDSSSSPQPLALASTAKPIEPALSVQNPSAQNPAVALPGGIAQVAKEPAPFGASKLSTIGSTTTLPTTGTAKLAPTELCAPSSQLAGAEAPASEGTAAESEAGPNPANATPLKDVDEVTSFTPSAADFAGPVHDVAESGALPQAIPATQPSNVGTQDFAAVLSPSFANKTEINKTALNPSADCGSSPVADLIRGSVTPDNCAASSAFIPPLATPQTRRESPTTSRLATENDFNIGKPPSSEAPKPPVDSQAPQTVDGTLAEWSASLPLVAVMFVTPNPSETPVIHFSADSAPSAAPPPTAVSAAPSERETTTANPAPGPATDNVPNQADGGDPIPASTATEQLLRKDWTAAVTAHVAAPLVVPPATSTSDAGDTAVVLGTSPAAPPPTRTNGGAAAPAETPNLPAASGEAPAPAPVSPVQMAQMVNHAAQSEMRIGLTTSAFGAVEVRTQVRLNEVGLSIGSEKGDLRAVLANEIPALTNRLQQQNLRLSQVNFHETSAFSGNSSSGGNQQRRFFSQSARVPSSSTETEAESSLVHGTTDNHRSRHAGLSVLA
jgi:hypothetical protein